MNLRFWPTLQIMAFSRAARGILYTFDLEILKSSYTTLERVRDCYAQQMEEKVSSIVFKAFEETFALLSISPRKAEEVKHLHLPPKLKRQMIGIVMAMGLEVRKWFEYHSSILHDDDLELRNRLAWFSFGIIDRFKTAQAFIQDETVSSVERLYLACKYYFDRDVDSLWTRMSENDRAHVAQDFERLLSTQYWLSALHSGNALDWRIVSLNESQDFFTGNFFGMRHYFTKLSRNKRFQCISLALRSNVHRYDIYSCLYQVNEEELYSILKSLPQLSLRTLIRLLLDWPFQIMFLDVANFFKEDINEVMLRDLVSCILFHKLEKGWQDHDYVYLLRSLWNELSDKCGHDVKKDGSLYAVLNYVLASSNPLNISEYRHFIDNFTSFRII